MFSHFSIKHRLLGMSIGPLLLMSVIIYLMITYQVSTLEDENIDSAREMLVAAKKSELKNIIGITYATIKPLYDARRPVEEAVSLMQRMEFGEDGYIFGYNENAIRVFSGSSDANIGQSYADYKDVNGVYLIRDLIQAGKNNNLGRGNNFVTYHFPRLNQSVPAPKLSYAIYLPNWDLMIGTGIYIDQIDKEVTSLATQINKTKSEILLTVAVIAALILIVFVAIALVISKSILTPLAEANASLEKLANGNGDLTQRLKVRDKFEMGALAQNVNNLLGSLQQLILKIRDVATKVKGETSLIANGAQNIATLSNEQNQEIEQMAAASTQMSETASHVTSNAESAAEAALTMDEDGKTALATVQGSCTQMKELVAEMSNASDVVTQVGQDSENIGAVLQVIESIAEQTNLLALNAAIEAARAGEQGRGFAVVADEVRNLASKTQGSTEEIQQMIQQLQEGSKAAVGAMSNSISRGDSTENSIKATSDNLTAIAQSVSTLTNVNAQIATAAEQQNVVGADISRRIVEISDKTARLTAISRENEKVVDTLNQSTCELEELVKLFKV